MRLGRLGSEAETGLEVTRNMFIDKLALLLAIIGALNWGSIGLFGFDVVAFLGGGQAAVISRIIYSLVGLAGIWCISLLFREHSTGESTT